MRRKAFWEWCQGTRYLYEADNARRGEGMPQNVEHLDQGQGLFVRKPE